jgi:ABC-2 type transport system ATP-binding protein
MIEVAGLTKRYGPTLAVSDVSFEVQKGEVLGFLGPNGAGKTTTMRVITGYLSPSEGRVRVAGYDVVEEPLEAKRRTGYLPEAPPVYPDMTVVEYLAFVARIKGLPRKEIKTRIEEVSEKCAVTDVTDRQIGKLSKGYRQRVGLAQALIHKPEVLILDEPTAGLDPDRSEKFVRLIRELREEHRFAVLMVTHDLDTLNDLSTRVAVLADQHIIACGPLEEIRDLPHRFVQNFFGGDRGRRAFEAG